MIDTSDPLALALQFGAIGVLLYIAPILRSIDGRLSELVDAARGVVTGARAAGVPLPEKAGMADAVTATIKRIAPLVVLLLLTGCVSSKLAASAATLERNLDRYRRASAPRPGVDPAQHAALGSAVTVHAHELLRLAQEAQE